MKKENDMNDDTARISLDEVEVRLLYRAMYAVQFIGNEEEQASVGKKLIKAYSKLTDGRYLRADVGLGVFDDGSLAWKVEGGDDHEQA
jgi:hypothetical protein